MFEKRLKIILAIICLAAMAMGLRAAQIQILQKDEWKHEASSFLTQRRFIETIRGRILDNHGVVLAEDQPCMDACVEYPAITEDWEQYKKWLHDRAALNCEKQFGAAYTKAKLQKRKDMLATESDRIRVQVAEMWTILAAVSGKSPDEIDDVRHNITSRVEMRRQYLAWNNYQRALARLKNTPVSPWYGRLFGGTTKPSALSSPNTESPAEDDDGPKLDDYEVDVADQAEAHIILPAIDATTYNQLAKRAEELPGLVLRPGLKRVYPQGEAACHVLGRLAAVDTKQLAEDPNQENPLRKYWPADLAGRDGVEAMCEQTLRGWRGEQTSVDGDAFAQGVDPMPGRDVKLSIDIQLQSAAEQAFVTRRSFTDAETNEVEIRENQPGAAVVIDVASGKVLALASYPLFNPNTLATDFAKLNVDDLHEPMLNRATRRAFPPGSIVKPLLGLGALTDGTITPESTIECTGYLVIDGRRQSIGRCWTIREYGDKGALAEHHQIPTSDPHPTGFLTVSDAIERSCNVFFETLADRMGMQRQHEWYDRFGLGRPTGIGLPEDPGHLPNPENYAPAERRLQTWFAGIGQSVVTATPLQMANVTAAIARGGIWMRPRLLDDQPLAAGDIVDLHVPPAAVAAVKDGMYRVVNAVAGTGHMYRGQTPDAVDDIRIAGKTGTPQASRLTIPARDEQGQIITEDGRTKRVLVDPKDPAVANWYVGTGPEKADYSHAWFIGYAPAEHPQIAFAVFVEYGHSGGSVAGSIVRDILAAAIKQGYLSAP